MSDRTNDIRQKRATTRVGGRVVNVYKRMCETPLERLERLRKEKPEFAREALSYAGRLDPMAEGVMLVLVGSANSEREKYLDMSKEYVLDVLFGFATDTYDVLGRVMESGDTDVISKKAIEFGLNQFRGTLDQEYPPYASKTVEGKSLFEWARSNMLGSIVVPRHLVNVYDIELQSIYRVGEKTLYNYIEENVGKVNGDFRQDEVLTVWSRHIRKTGERSFPCATVKIACSSGAYARSIAHTLGQELGAPALALHILRTKVGEYSIEKSIK